MALADQVGMRSTASKLFSLEPGEPMSPQKVSAVLGWLSSEVGEPLRIAATVALTPKVRAALARRRDAAAALKDETKPPVAK